MISIFFVHLIVSQWAFLCEIDRFGRVHTGSDATQLVTHDASSVNPSSDHTGFMYTQTQQILKSILVILCDEATRFLYIHRNMRCKNCEGLCHTGCVSSHPRCVDSATHETHDASSVNSVSLMYISVFFFPCHVSCVESNSAQRPWTRRVGNCTVQYTYCC